MQKVIIHKPTRVIRRVSIEEAPEIDIETEEIIEVENPLDLKGGFWKLDTNNEKVAALDAEIDEAGVDAVRENEKAKARKVVMKALIKDIAENGATLKKVENYFKLLNQQLK